MLVAEAGEPASDQQLERRLSGTARRPAVGLLEKDQRDGGAATDKGADLQRPAAQRAAGEAAFAEQFKEPAEQPERAEEPAGGLPRGQFVAAVGELEPEEQVQRRVAREAECAGRDQQDQEGLRE